MTTPPTICLLTSYSLSFWLDERANGVLIRFYHCLAMNETAEQKSDLIAKERGKWTLPDLNWPHGSLLAPLEDESRKGDGGEQQLDKDGEGAHQFTGAWCWRW